MSKNIDDSVVRLNPELKINEEKIHIIDSKESDLILDMN